MNCAEFQEVLPEVIEGGRTAEQESHLKSCPVCSGLVADLDLIASEARQLQDVAEPNPRVWTSIEIALRQEGIIRDPQPGPDAGARRSAALEPGLAGAGGGYPGSRVRDLRLPERTARLQPSWHQQASCRR